MGSFVTDEDQDQSQAATRPPPSPVSEAEAFIDAVRARDDGAAPGPADDATHGSNPVLARLPESALKSAAAQQAIDAQLRAGMRDHQTESTVDACSHWAEVMAPSLHGAHKSQHRR
jgi:hypothetical protein